MSEIQLRRLEEKDEKAFMQAFAEWTHSPGFGFFRGFDENSQFSSYLERTRLDEKGEQLPEGLVSETHLYAFLGESIVGKLSLRHELNDFLKKIGGHIGYGVIEKYRRRGFASEMLLQSLPYAKELGISKVLVTCDDDNIGSIKTIEKGGGVLENKIEQEGDKPLKRRYWIQI